MRSTLSTTPGWSDEDLRFMRLARGARAVAAVVIIGGIVVAAFQTAPTSDRLQAHEPMPAATTEFATSESVTGAAPSEAPAMRDADPAPKRTDRPVANRG